LKAAKLGEEIVIDARVLKRGKTLAFLEVEIRNKANDDLLVKGTHTKFVG
jgi:acyl-coenzyme A thioesterase 13